MNRERVVVAIRWITAALLAYLAIGAALQGGHARVIGGSELFGAVLFAIPRVWRIGGALLPVVIAAAFTIHTLTGGPPLQLVFPALLIVLILAVSP